MILVYIYFATGLQSVCPSLLFKFSLLQNRGNDDEWKIQQGLQISLLRPTGGEIIFWTTKRRSMLPYISGIEGLYRGPLYMIIEGQSVYNVTTDKCKLIAPPLCWIQINITTIVYKKGHEKQLLNIKFLFFLQFADWFREDIGRHWKNAR